MKIKPLDLRNAYEVASVKDTSTQAVKKNSWAAVHRLTAQSGANRLQLHTTDSQLWLTYNIPAEQVDQNLDILVTTESFKPLAIYTDGGTLSVTTEAGTTVFTRGQLRYPLKHEAQRNYPNPILPSSTPVTWEADAKILAQSLRFVNPFIDETASNESRAVATLYDHGLYAGSIQRAAILTGLTCAHPLSFRTKAIRAVATFLESLAGKVKIAYLQGAENETSFLRFTCPTFGHELVLAADLGRFEASSLSFETKLTETVIVDRKLYLARAQLLRGAMADGQTRLLIGAKAINEAGQLLISTRTEVPIPGDTTSYAEDTIPCSRAAYRRADDTPETLRDKTNNLRNKDTYQLLNADHLISALNAMDSTSVIIHLCGNKASVITEDASEPDAKAAAAESQAAAAGSTTTRSDTTKSVLLVAKSVQANRAQPAVTPATTPTTPTQPAVAAPATQAAAS